MLVTVLSWLAIMLVFSLWGVIGATLINCIFGYRIKEIKSIFVLGLVETTVYAEMFSIFYRVRFLATIVMVGICVIGIILCRKNFIYYLRSFFNTISCNRHYLVGMIFVLLSVTFFGAYLSSQTPGGYDTLNYHIPAIRWIEEYGIVRGLGNLHTRFAYNSSFLCLQALFSFSGFWGSSLHSMNGFIWVFMVVSTIGSLSIFKHKRISLADVLRIFFIILLFRNEELSAIASPNTDFLPMCLTAFIFIEWVELSVNRENDCIPYGLISILCLFTASVKLSAAVLFVFALAPIVGLIKSKRIAEILKFAVLGIIVFLPYVVREVIISGYLLYPVAGLDIFNFDWEIPKAAVISDQLSITIFARNWGQGWTYKEIDKSFFEWFAEWVEKSEAYYGVVAISNLFFSVVAIFLAIWGRIKSKKNIYELMMMIVPVVGFWYLIISAPSIRFGRWWFIALPVIVVYEIIAKVRPYTDSTEMKYEKGSLGFEALLYLIIVLFILGDFTSFVAKADSEENKVFAEISKEENGEDKNWLLDNDFWLFAEDYGDEGSYGETYRIGSYDFYYCMPAMGFNNLNGYYGFPGTECLKILDRIELRGVELSDGFRVQNKYVDIPFDFQGEIITDDILETMGLEKYYKPGMVDEDYIGINMATEVVENLSQYVVKEDSISVNIDSNTVDNNIRTLVGWAAINEALYENPDMGQICVEVDNEYYRASEVMRMDVVEYLGADDVKLGFVIRINAEAEYRICIIDFENSTIYH